MTVIFTLLAIAGSLLATLSCSRQPSYTPAAQIGRDIVIDTASLEDGIPQFHTYRYLGKNINYFAVKTRGTVLSFLDACTNCYTHKRGYRSGNGNVTCRHCGTTLPADKLDKGLGSCCPIRIEGRTKDGKYLIPATVLERAADRF